MRWTLINTVLLRESCLLAALLTTDSFTLLFSASPKALLIAFKLGLIQYRTRTGTVVCYRSWKQKHDFGLYISPELIDRASDIKLYKRKLHACKRFHG